MTPTTETWLPVLGYEGFYEVSDLGRVRSLDRWIQAPGMTRPWLRPGQLMKGVSDGQGRHVVRLTANGKREKPRIYTLVLTAFVGPRPLGMEGCHNDGDCGNNRLDNLRWDTPSANRFDSVRHGTNPSSKKAKCLRGHAFVAANVLPNPEGHRRCRACGQARNAQRSAWKHGLEFDFQASSDKYYAQMMHTTKESPCLSSP